MSSKTSKRSWLDWLRPLLRELWQFDAYSHVVLLLLGLFVLISALAGFLMQGEIPAGFRGFSLLLFKVGQVFVLESGGDPPDNPALALARIGAVALVFLGVAKLLIAVYRDTFRLMGMSDHVVICGLGRIGIQLARDVHEEGSGGGLVVIERDQDNPHIPTCQAMGAVVLVGDATDPEVLRRARVGRAGRVFAVTGDDTTDVDTAVRLCAVIDPAPPNPGATGQPASPTQPARTIQCFVHFVDLALMELLSGKLLLLGRSRQVNVRVFSAFTNSARLLIRDHLAKDRPRPSTTGGPEEDQLAHYVIVGFGQMGQALALEAARLAHFENLKRLRMTIIDDDIERKRDLFLGRYPRFCPESLELDCFDPLADDWASRHYRPAKPYQVNDEPAVEYACNAEFLEMPQDFSVDRLADDLARRLSDSTVRPNVIVCFDEDRRNFEAAVLLKARLGGRFNKVPIYVWLPVQIGLTELLTGSGSPLTDGGTMSAAIGDIIPFAPRDEQIYNLKEIMRPGSEEFARANHEYYCRLFPQPNRPSGRPWEELSEPYRMSNYLAAEHLHVKLLAIQRRRVPLAEAPRDQEIDKIEPHELELLAQMEHNRWLAERLLDGWSYARERDDGKKRHPDVCAWANLLPKERERDVEQVRHIPEILKMIPDKECIVPE